MRLPVALFLILVASLFTGLFTARAAQAQAEGPADLALKRQLVDQYLTEERFGPLYEKVLAQYAAFTPPSRASQSAGLIGNPDFRSRIFRIVRDKLVSSYTLPELQAEAQFLKSPDGQSIERKINEQGLSFRNKDLSPSELQALRDFNATPVGQSVAHKNTAFISQTLSQIFKTFLLYQSNL